MLWKIPNCFLKGSFRVAQSFDGFVCYLKKRGGKKLPALHFRTQNSLKYLLGLCFLHSRFGFKPEVYFPNMHWSTIIMWVVEDYFFIPEDVSLGYPTSSLTIHHCDYSYFLDAALKHYFFLWVSRGKLSNNQVAFTLILEKRNGIFDTQIHLSCRLKASNI